MKQLVTQKKDETDDEEDAKRRKYGRKQANKKLLERRRTHEYEQVKRIRCAKHERRLEGERDDEMEKGR